jgi:hypothetical protein
MYQICESGLWIHAFKKLILRLELVNFKTIFECLKDCHNPQIHVFQNISETTQTHDRC